MARWNDLAKLRMGMEQLQAQVRHLHKRGFTPEKIAGNLGIPEQSARIIIKWKCKGEINNG